jgi:hypothetical protein
MASRIAAVAARAEAAARAAILNLDSRFFDGDRPMV